MDQLTSEQKTALQHLENELDRGNKARRLLGQVYKMRQAQRAYFKSKEQSELVKSKELEQQVDAALEALKKRS